MGYLGGGDEFHFVFLTDYVNWNLFAVEDMIKEVDKDGDGRIDFYEFVYALGEPGNEDSYDDDDEEIIYS